MVYDYKYICYGYILDLNNGCKSVSDDKDEMLTPIDIKWDSQYLRRIYNIIKILEMRDK